MKTREFENQDVKDITEFLEWMESNEPVAYFVEVLTLIFIILISVYMLTHWGAW